MKHALQAGTWFLPHRFISSALPFRKKIPLKGSFVSYSGLNPQPLWPQHIVGVQHSSSLDE